MSKSWPRDSSGTDDSGTVSISVTLHYDQSMKGVTLPMQNIRISRLKVSDDLGPRMAMFDGPSSDSKDAYTRLIFYRNDGQLGECNEHSSYIEKAESRDSALAHSFR